MKTHSYRKKLIKKTSTFKKRNSDEIYHIGKPVNWNSKKTVYLIECNQCWKQYTGSSKTKFRYRANNYKSTHRKFKNKKQVPKEAVKQKLFHEHFCSDDHNGIQDWVITLIEQVDNEKFLRQRELFWIYKSYVLPKWLKPERDLCSLLITRILFNQFSDCEDIYIFMYIYH